MKAPEGTSPPLDTESRHMSTCPLATNSLRSPRPKTPLGWQGIGLASLLSLALLSGAAQADKPRGFTLEFHPVGSSDTGGGPPKIGEPGFIPPVALAIHMPPEAACLARKGAGAYEALITAEGKVAGVHSHYEPVDGDRCERTRLFPYIRQWRFAPATYEGKPVSVYLWIGIEGTDARP